MTAKKKPSPASTKKAGSVNETSSVNKSSPTAPQDLGALLDQQQERFSHELHDSLLPLLFVARMQAERLHDTCDDPDRAEQLATLVGYLATATSEGRRLITENQPPELERTDWQSALQHYVSSGLPPHDVIIDLQFQATAAELPPAVALAFYRIAQEAIRNAVKHAQARRIVVTTTGSGQHCELVVQDDGRGFDPDDVPSGHFGLRNITRRTEAVGGAVAIESAIDRGTRIRVTI